SRAQLDAEEIKLHTASGPVGKIDGSMRAMMAEYFLENLALHTHRGMQGVIRDGRHAGGRAYGYRAVTGTAGALEIVEAEAEVVRRIFADYVAGATPRDIAAKLNRERI